MAATPVALPSDHASFVKQFVATASENNGAASHDGEGCGISKRQKTLAEDAKAALSAPVARFGLGGDDNLYLQLGLSVLHTADAQRPLAPSALYSADVVLAIQEGIKRNVLMEIKERNELKSDKLKLVKKKLTEIFESADLENESSNWDEMTDEEFVAALKRLKADLESDTLAFVVNTIAPSVPTPPPLSASVTQAPIVQYAFARGLCGHRGPMEALTSAPTDRLLPYAAPARLGACLASCKGMVVPSGASTHTGAPPRSPLAIEEALAAFHGNFAIDDADEDGNPVGTVRDARQVRWQPVGEHAVALANAAALEHLIARCGQVLRTETTLSSEAQAVVRGLQVQAKCAQLDSLNELACAAEDGVELHQPPTEALVTRPVAFLRGKMHTAHDAGHHPAPDVSTVLATQRWTAEHARADAEYRRTASSTLPTYKAPKVDELGYVPIATGAPTPARDRPSLDPIDSEDITTSIKDMILRIINFGLYYGDVPDNQTIESSLNAVGSFKDAKNTAETRRSGVWNEMLRDIAVSTDRLWTFVRTLSGLIGEDADSLLVTADEATAAAARELQAQRKATADRLAAFQSKVVEMLIGSMIKESKLRLDTNPEDAQDSLVVVDADKAKEMAQLLNGTSGRPYFDANVSVQAALKTGQPQRLGDVVSQLHTVVQGLHKALDAELLTPQVAGATLAELSLPRNSYFVRLREDTVAAIRSAFDKFQVECAIAGIGRISLWELIEGSDHTLCTRFAEFVGHVLIQNRTSTGVSAMYTSRQQLSINAAQAANSLRRVVHHASHYRTTYPTPVFSGNLENARKAYFAKYSEQSEVWIHGNATRSIAFAVQRYSRYM